MTTAATMRPEHVDQLRAVFDKCDADGSGAITIDELRGAMEAFFGGELGDDDLAVLMRELDTDGNGEIESVLGGWVT